MENNRTYIIKIESWSGDLHHQYHNNDSRVQSQFIISPSTLDEVDEDMQKAIPNHIFNHLWENHQNHLQSQNPNPNTGEK